MITHSIVLTEIKHIYAAILLKLEGKNGTINLFQRKERILMAVNKFCA